MPNRIKASTLDEILNDPLTQRYIIMTDIDDTISEYIGYEKLNQKQMDHLMVGFKQVLLSVKDLDDY